MGDIFNDTSKEKLERHKKQFTEYKRDVKNKVDYKKIYNEMTYVSSGIHLKQYLPICFKYVKVPANWLEVGCGACRDGLLHVHNKGFNVYGFDVVKKSVEIAKSYGLKNIIEHSAHENFPYTDEMFDFVSACDVLEHLEYDDVIFSLSEIHRVLKKNKYALLASCTRQALDHVHITIQSNEEWIQLYEKMGFKFIGKHFQYGIIIQKI